MKPHLLALFTASAVLFSLSNASALEKNGLSVTVQKKTLDRADQRGGYYTSDRIDRTQGLKVTVKNVTLKPMPEGQIEWTILVRNYASSGIDKYAGKEALKPIKSAETIDLIIGAAQIEGWRSWGEQWKDKVEWQVVITQGGKETMRMASTSSFEVLNKRAVKAAAPR